MLGLCVAIVGSWTAAGQTASRSLEYKVKAAYLFNFAKYVEWPQSAFASPEAPVVIGILGQDPFGEVMEETISDRRVGKRPVQVKRSRRIHDLTNCHLLFICPSERDRLGRILAAAKSTPALTVSEIPQFCLSGGMITLVVESNAVRFDVDLDNAEQCGLKLSARMLTAARTVFSRKRDHPK